MMLSNSSYVLSEDVRFHRRFELRSLLLLQKENLWNLATIDKDGDGMREEHLILNDIIYLVIQ